MVGNQLTAAFHLKKVFISGQLGLISVNQALIRLTYGALLITGDKILSKKTKKITIKEKGSTISNQMEETGTYWHQAAKWSTNSQNFLGKKVKS